MSTRYHRNGHAAYECSASRADQMATSTCRSISAVTVDEAVAERLLDALNPDDVADLEPAAAGPPSWPWSGPATRPNGRSGRSTPASRRTVSWPAASSPA